MNLLQAESNTYSQDGVDGVLQVLTNKYVRNRCFVELGCGNGTICNSRLLRINGWNGVAIDAEAANSPPIIQAELTQRNVQELLDSLKVPPKVGLLSIDLDYNTYWVLSGVKTQANIVVVEYNGQLPVNESLVVANVPSMRWDGSSYYGASLLAYVELLEPRGYKLIYCDSAGVNAYFVESHRITRGDRIGSLEELFRPTAKPFPVSERQFQCTKSSSLADALTSSPTGISPSSKEQAS